MQIDLLQVGENAWVGECLIVEDDRRVLNQWIKSLIL